MEIKQIVAQEIFSAGDDNTITEGYEGPYSNYYSMVTGQIQNKILKERRNIYGNRIDIENLVERFTKDYLLPEIKYDAKKAITKPGKGGMTLCAMPVKKADRIEDSMRYQARTVDGLHMYYKTKPGMVVSKIMTARTEAGKKLNEKNEFGYQRHILDFKNEEIIESNQHLIDNTRKFLDEVL